MRSFSQEVPCLLHMCTSCRPCAQAAGSILSIVSLIADAALLSLQEVRVHGVTQTVHVMVTTYGEAAEMVRECVIRLLAAPEPVYMEKYIYICDDGHAKSEGPKKRAVVEDLRTLGVITLSAYAHTVQVLVRVACSCRALSPEITLWVISPLSLRRSHKCLLHR